MALTSGTRLGPYEVIAPIGAGGMGEVYRARDTKLHRDVAMKVLPETFTSDPDRLARFQREAKVLASLNHQNIAHIHGYEESGGVHALVMELVEGPTLADRIARGPISVDEALSIARQIAEALEGAHQQGIIHRDLKPANIKVREDGTVKVLDFGLAKLVDPVGGNSPGLTNSPTLSLQATHAGMILGTAAYMSPEQARGKTVDKRADIWAFGCLLFEMLTGRRAFPGHDAPEILGAVIHKDPTWEAVPASVPASVRATLRRCLQKDPKQRLRDIGDVQFELGETETSDRALLPQSSTASSRGREYLAWTVATVAIALAVGVMWVHTPQEESRASTVARTAILLPTDHMLASSEGASSLTVSQDGARIAYVAEQDGRRQLYVRDLSELEPRALAGSEGARDPFFSPDGQWLAYFANGALQKVAVTGGAPLRICNVASVSAGGSWASGDTIVFATHSTDLSVVKADGGVPHLLAGSGPAAWPQILPDGRTVLFTTRGQAIATMPIDGQPKHIVARTNDSSIEGPAVLGTGYLLQARFIPGGYLLYGQSPGIVRAIRFDLTSATVSGSSVSLLESVEQPAGAGAVAFAASTTGLFVYASTGDRHQLVWVDRKGTETPISVDRQAFRDPRLSPDGTRVAVAINDQTRRSDIWIYDAERGRKSRLTTAGHNLSPVWTPDGLRVTFSSGGTGIRELAADGGGTGDILMPQERIRALLPTGTYPYPSSWSPDGQSLLFEADSRDLWVLSRGTNTVPGPVLPRPTNALDVARFSPDGQWIAYASDESGRDEVYAARYPNFGNKVPISTDGGTNPQWSRDRHELFYRQGDALMAVAIDTNREVMHAGKPQRLFAGRYAGTGRNPSFDVSSDGQRFVMVKSDEASTLRQLTVVQNWAGELRRLIPSK